MKVSRKKMDRKVDRRVSGVKRKAVKSHSVIARKPHRVARTSKRTHQGVKSLKRKAASGQRTTQSKAHETAETVGKFLEKRSEMLNALSISQSKLPKVASVE